MQALFLIFFDFFNFSISFSFPLVSFHTAKLDAHPPVFPKQTEGETLHDKRMNASIVNMAFLRQKLQSGR